MIRWVLARVPAHLGDDTRGQVEAELVEHARTLDAGQLTLLGKWILVSAPTTGNPGTIDGVRTLLNVIWLLLCGIWMALGYLLAGIVCCVLIITIPFGLASFRIASFALWPFGRTLVRRADAGASSVIGDVIWIIFAGLWLAIAHVLTAVALGLTIIGLPLAVANLKLVPVSLTPLGRVIVPIAD